MVAAQVESTALQTSADELIKMRDVVKTFKNAAGEFVVLKGIDLTIKRGEFAAVVGKSGSGKSTLLNMITGIDHPTSGQVVIGGTDIYKMTESQRSLWRGKNLGIVFQFFQLLPMLTLLENVMLPMDYVGMYDFEERPKKAMALLEMVGLENQAHTLPLSVSTGQQQAAAIARALATNPPLIVADEPTGNLDSRAAEAIIDLFEELVESGKTIVMVTHDPSMTSRVSRTVTISDGILINEIVAGALPLLTHPQMLEITRKLERHVYQPGENIIRRDERVEYFFMIEKGEVDIVLQGKRRDDTLLARLNPGDFFGEIELIRGGKSIANVRAAAEGPVELLALSRADFNQMLDESPLTQEAISNVVQDRLQEHKAVDRRKKWKLFG
ncbi:MAG: ATP-binding cassette domain-containing protein [Anaerolineales bacterium]|jgi:ABC-type lipoprotein export system ATPase subunit